MHLTYNNFYGKYLGFVDSIKIILKRANKDLNNLPKKIYECLIRTRRDAYHHELSGKCKLKP